MVNNYPEYAAGVNYKKTDSNDITHFYSAQVVADPSDDTIESKLIKDGVVISEGGPTVEALNVTENGTYSEEGKAYSPVVVNVAGGSSDFSTAEVTVTNNLLTNGVSLNIPTAFEDEPSFSSGSAALEPSQSVTMSVILFKGLALATYNSDASSVDVEVTGDIIYDSQYGELQITGNGTVVFSSK